eukprot:GHVT01087866.1.p1 GENE.GHVT01087866.1~~GHVT01087866.1.p1  ORF type:complete len:351 (+),score=19.82 GHVT01087866.1:1049-2101(+)
MATRRIVGTGARTVAMLTAFQRFIEDYTPMPYQSIERDLKVKLDQQINFITHCRPHSIAMGGAVRWLKKKLAGYAPNQDLDQTRARLLTDISNFVSERIITAAWTIADHVAQSIIEDGDRILVFGHSTAVTLALLQAKNYGKSFSVIVVDCYPFLEGQETARECAEAGIEVTYTLLNGLSYLVQESSLTLLGSVALLANAFLVNRTGSATTAMMAKEHVKPVLVLCESFKLSDRVLLDSCCYNELSNPDVLWNDQGPRYQGIQLEVSTKIRSQQPVSAGKLQQLSAAPRDDQGTAPEPLSRGRQIFPVAGVTPCNPCYDVTPNTFIDYVVTEAGVSPATNVPALARAFGI